MLESETRLPGVGSGRRVGIANETKGSLLWVVGLSLSDSRPTSAEPDAAPAAPLSRHSIASLAETRALLPSHAEHCAALVTTSRRGKKQFPGSSHGVVSKMPLRRHHPVCPAPTEVGPEVPTSNAVRPCRSSRLRRFAPHRALRACCIPLPTMGSARFEACRRRPKSPNARPSAKRKPFRAFPSTQAEPRHPDIAAWFTETRSPLAVFSTLPVRKPAALRAAPGV
jgi:hypothetical protein